MIKRKKMSSTETTVRIPLADGSTIEANPAAVCNLGDCLPKRKEKKKQILPKKKNLK
ncbi:MAG: hypothetical protein SGJ27_31140 [Candidatus Melainabacteria bacterium]|nr:hypothetical protein [Candidatus Melainabacteria bacterium]